MLAISEVIDCMWDLEKAADHALNFTGEIPKSNNSIIDFVNEYKKSELYEFHKKFDATESIPHGDAVEKALKESNITDRTRYILYEPNPMAVQPIDVKEFVHDFVINAEWKPKHVANILRDIYNDDIKHGWVQDFKDRYPAEEKANFWTRTFASMAYWKAGRLKA